ncbi:HK97-gp10 family putative phage morphogenesis protein [Lysinibacillus sp. FSL W7-1291]|uniref:HK97-gp10 family putative phage morphogenesis protein n=1 Tax=Lysinibacillus sp. FSL W7-1291 TaxID=2954544 RepID=UPI00315A1912
MNFEIQGMDALMQNLMNLQLEEAEENKALNAGAKVVKEAVEKEVPVGKSKNKKNKLKNNIKIKRAKDGEAKVHTAKAYHGHILEGGRSAGSKYVTKKGKRQKVTWGPIAPNPFFTRGFELSKPGALNAIADEIKKAKNL